MAKKKDIVPVDINIDALFNDVRNIINQGISQSVHIVHSIACMTYWKIGQRIIEDEQQGERRAEYGKQVLNKLAERLTDEYGENDSYSSRDLRNYRQFFLTFNDFPKWYARVPNLTWTHYRSLLRVSNTEARMWYLNEANSETWTTRTLDRNINSQYYFRLLQSSDKKEVIKEMKANTLEYQKDKFEFIKNPIVADFLGFGRKNDYTESKLETAIISHLQKFIMELGKGYAFVARQQLIRTDLSDYYIDLVFYNYILKFFLLVDLKTTEITHQDIGQMDMYIRMYDELKCTEGDNPTIGLLLCAETSNDLAQYSVLHDNDQLFAAKYLTYLPKKEDLLAEIERQKEFFELQEGKRESDLESNDERQ